MLEDGSDDPRSDDPGPVDPPDAHSAPTRSVPLDGATSAERPGQRLQPGDRFGRYRVLRLLGRGGMGEVYEAEDDQLGRRVALKTLSSRQISEADRRRFLREGRLAASLTHPNSVYIYGTEEIEGTLAISMELVAGGSLEERVEEEGPLEPGEAVDAILQVVAGLEAAAAKGILHRDVKPSNCFVTERGTVKVGDFGLSLPVEATDETRLTMTHTLLGTPAFASPEQLQGEDLDLRSDIYSVGATLYWLLTARIPFETDNIAKLIASVAHEPAPSPRQVREEVPAGLAKVVTRCLEKEPGKRFGSHAELAAALAPFASGRPDAAPVGRRFLAFMVDSLVWLLGLALAFELRGADAPAPGDTVTVATLVAGFAWTVAYYGLCEGIWGASPGKRLQGLRVRDTAGGRAAFSQALVRSSIFAVCLLGGDALDHVFEASELGFSETALEILEALAVVVLPLSLFVTARRANGWRGIHEFVSGTAVVRAERTAAARGLIETAAPAGPGPAQHDRAESGFGAGFEALGPYRIETTLSAGERERLVAAHDAQLDRRVWLHLRPPGTASVSERRRQIDRITRLRWIDGDRTDELAWDAYEAPEGRAFLQLSEPLPWETVRHLMRDIVEEIVATQDAGETPPRLTLDRLWLTDDGRIKLLDFPAPGVAGGMSPAPEEASIGTPDARSAGSEDRDDTSSVQRFVWRVAALALHGGAPSDPSTRDETRRSEPAGDTVRSTAEPTLPLHATQFLAALREQRSWSPDELLDRIRELSSRPTELGIGRRCASIAALGFLPLLFAVVLGPGAGVGLLLLEASFTVVSAAILREGPVLRAARLVLVTHDGSRASRGRVAVRSVIVFIPALVWLAVGVSLATPELVSLPPEAEPGGLIFWTAYQLGFNFGAIERALGSWSGGLVLAVMLSGAVWSLVDRHRGPQDHLAGTRVVRR